MSSYDAIVVGAGIAGASTAYFLAAQGMKIAHVEQTHPAGGPTGRSSALTHAFYLMPELSQLAIKGVSTLRRIPDLTGEAPVHFEIGMMWACGRDAAASWAAAARRINREGSVIEELAPDEFARRYPEVDTDGIVLALWEPAYGYADPYGATNALAGAARRMGAAAFYNTRVRHLIVDGGRIAGVETDTAAGRLDAPIVVAAGGVWSKPLLAAAGIELPIYVERHEMAVLEAGGRARSFMPFAWCDDLLNSYARPDGERVVLCGLWTGGGTGIRNLKVRRPEKIDDPDHYNEGVSEEESLDILAHMTPRFPTLAELGVRPGYSGLYDMSPDDNPIIGPAPGIQGLYVICGSSGHGFKLGAGVGEEVARLITTGDCPLLKPFGLERFLGRQRS
jgi:sarcosine oxidase subunit beta